MKRSPRTREELVTVQEFYRLIPDGQKADLIDGVISVASPDSRRPNAITGFLFALLEMFAAARQLGGEVYVNRFSFRLSPYRAPEPDVAYVRAERLHLITEREMRGGPDVAIEVVSPDSRRRDYRDKKRIYEEAKVAEYWIIDPGKSHVEFHRLVQGKYQ